MGRRLDEICLHNKKPQPGFILRAGGFEFNLGNVRLSHTLARAVPSGLKGLTSVFGTGTGGSLSLQSPKSQRPGASLQVDLIPYIRPKGNMTSDERWSSSKAPRPMLDYLA